MRCNVNDAVLKNMTLSKGVYRDERGTLVLAHLLDAHALVTIAQGWGNDRLDLIPHADVIHYVLEPRDYGAGAYETRGESEVERKDRHHRVSETGIGAWPEEKSDTWK